MKFIVSVLLVAFSISGYGQERTITIDDLNYYADITANGGLPDTRLRAHKSLKSGLEHWLERDDINIADLESIKYISTKRADDASFTIVTWQVMDASDQYQYYGYIIDANGKIFPLINTNDEVNTLDIIYEKLDKDNWYGALYYNIYPTKVNGKTAYLLFGYDGHEGYEHRKIVDVLSFENDEPVFGAEIFKRSENTTRPTLYTRILLSYSADANVSMNYNDQLSMITYDHLIPRVGRLPDQGPTLVPDGSYIGYKWDGSYWNYIDKIYDQVSDVPPTDGKRKTSGRNLFGGMKNDKVKKKRK